MALVIIFHLLMINLFQESSMNTAEKNQIKAAILSFHETCQSCISGKVVRRFEFSVETLDLMSAFGSFPGESRLYWSNREETEVVIGFGVADAVSDSICNDTGAAMDLMTNKLHSCDKGVRFYGGIAFNQQSDVAEEWDEFGAFQFVVPLIELIKRNDSYFVAYNNTFSDLKHLVAILDSVFPEKSNDLIVVKDLHLKREFASSEGQEPWCTMVRDVLDSFSDTLHKVVLARKQPVVSDSVINTVDVMSPLFKRNHSTYNFCFEFLHGIAFVGSSPECLYKREFYTVYCEAVAGTCCVANGDHLSTSTKDLLEHSIVHEQILKDLTSLCSVVSVPRERETLDLSELKHLFSSFSGSLKRGITDSIILHALHPTAAVCGESRNQAMNKIVELESFSRGWYSGPVGWISSDSAEFAVAIRSALVSSNTISVFGGAGIVEQSVPKQEWDETEQKMSQFFDILGCK